MYGREAWTTTSITEKESRTFEYKVRREICGLVSVPCRPRMLLAKETYVTEHYKGIDEPTTSN